jgi:hypothetical protein
LYDIQSDALPQYQCDLYGLIPFFFQEFLKRYSLKKEMASAIQCELEHLFYELNKDNAEQEVLLKSQLTDSTGSYQYAIDNFSFLLKSNLIKRSL